MALMGYILLEGLVRKEALLQDIPQGRYFDSADNIVGEGVSEDGLCLILAQPAGTEIEQHLRVKLADGGSVSAFDIISKDFKLRLGVNGGIRREQQRLIGLLGIGLLSILPDEDFAVEDAFALISDDALVDFMAVAVGHGMIDGRVVIDQPAAINCVEAIEGAFAVFRT